MRVLLCDDDYSILHTIGEYLEIRDIEVDYCQRGEQAGQLAQQVNFDVIILDIMMPGQSGLDACRAIRAAGCDTPILFLTARDSLDDVLLGFSAGGDDYLVKPFVFEEMLARVLALGKRRSRLDKDEISIGELKINAQTREVTKRGDTLHLNPIQYQLLTYMAQKSPGVVTRNELQQAIWNDNVPDSDALRTHISNLRGVVDKPYSSRQIVTIHGVGYSLRSGAATGEAG